MDLGDLTLGLHDLIPVTLAAVGLALVAAAIGRVRSEARLAAVAGAVLAVLGGASKATSKLIAAAAGGEPPQLLDEALFPLLAPGMVLLAAATVAAGRAAGWASWIARRPAFVPLAVWPLVAIVAVSVGSRAATTLLIVFATAGNVTLGAELIRWSVTQGRRPAAALFAVNLIIIVGLAGMARALEQTTAAQWVEQNVNMLGQLAFVVAARWLWISVKEEEPAVDRGTQPDPR